MAFYDGVMSAGPLARLTPPTARTGSTAVLARSTSAASSWVVSPDCGAVVTFTGTVRDHAEGRHGIERLEYEAYEEYVIPAMETVASEARRLFPDIGRLVLWHRVGSLVVTDVAVVVAVSTPHRGAAFSAARWAIDEVKATTPIWKREHWPGGAEWVRCDHAHHDDDGGGTPVGAGRSAP